MIPQDLYDQNAMLATPSKDPDSLVTTLPSNYVFDIKWDGLRCLAYVDEGVVTMKTRTGESLNARYPDIVEALAAEYPFGSIVLDGELLCFDPATGLPDFNRGQKRSAQSIPSKIAAVVKTHPATFMAFDLLWYDGDDLRGQALAARTAVLRTIGGAWPSDGRLRVSQWSDDGSMMWAFVTQHRLEGLIAKDKGGLYRGRRDSGWIKLKKCLRVTAIVTGYEGGKGARAGKIGALLVSMLDTEGNLRSVGRVGTGLKERDHAPLMEVLDRGDQFLADVECMPPTTGDLQLRFPAYKGVRFDVTRESCTLDQIGA